MAHLRPPLGAKTVTEPTPAPAPPVLFLKEGIVRSLIDLVPETWKAAQLEATREGSAEKETIRVSITNPEIPRDVAGPDDDLLEAVHELSLVFHKHKHPWKKVRYLAKLAESGDWDFQAEYEYEGTKT